MIAIALAVGAAFLFALGTVLQQKGGSEESADAGMQADFLAKLAQRPVWLLGVLVEVIGFGLQATALGLGRLIVVQPIQVTSVVFALPLGVWLTAQIVNRREILGAVLTTAGLIAFLVLANPTGGTNDASVGAWLVAGGICVGVSVVLVGATLKARSSIRAAAVGSASGILFGLCAALTKSTVDMLDDGVLGVFTDWHVYALVAVSIAAFWLTQIALQHGLELAIATEQTLDSAVAVLIGTLLFNEQLHDSVGEASLAIAALVVAAVGLYTLVLSQPAAKEPVNVPAGAG